MKKIAGLIALMLMMGVVGYGVGLYLNESKSATTLAVSEEAQGKEVLYKLPLGRFTVQVIKPDEYLNIRFKLDVFIVGAANFERMSDGLSRLKMREDVMRLLSNMAETSLRTEDRATTLLEPDNLAHTIASKLHHGYIMVRTAKVTELASSLAER